MKSIAAVLATAIGFAWVSSVAAQSDTPPLMKNPRIVVEYEEPRHPIYSSVYDPADARFAKQFAQNVKTYEVLSGIKQRLMKRQVLEEFSQFLAPVKLPIELRLVANQCGFPDAYYSPAESKIVLCYEYVWLMTLIAPKATTPQGITRQEAIIGSIVGVMLHEGGHAISNLLRLPVLAREEDTADQIAAFVMMQFGRDVARTLIKGEAYSWNAVQAFGPRPYWGSHSTALQRQHNYLCIAYGADPAGFEDFVKKFNWLPERRAANCANEYRQVQHAFRTTILPHLDADLLEKVRAHKWLRTDDARQL